MSYKAVSGMTVEEFTRHLEKDHPGSLAMQSPAMADRDVWNAYHEHLHKAPRRVEHYHKPDWEGNEMANRGWKQITACVCLNPPTHRPDCTGKLGLQVVDETHGPSAMGKLWDALDLLTDELKSLTCEDMKEGRARATAYCYALALMLNPSQPDMNAVRQEAMRRWKERNNG